MATTCQLDSPINLIIHRSQEAKVILDDQRRPRISQFKALYFWAALIPQETLKWPSLITQAPILSLITLSLLTRAPPIKVLKINPVYIKALLPLNRILMVKMWLSHHKKGKWFLYNSLSTSLKVVDLLITIKIMQLNNYSILRQLKTLITQWLKTLNMQAYRSR